jgi:hypothetical protein
MSQRSAYTARDGIAIDKFVLIHVANDIGLHSQHFLRPREVPESSFSASTTVPANSHFNTDGQSERRVNIPSRM